ncbi:hypothetical protein M9458_040731, partial [Cirrhinus mrigala]
MSLAPRLLPSSFLDTELKWPRYTEADGQNHWHPALVTSDDRLFVSSCPDLHFCSSGAFFLWSAASALLHSPSFGDPAGDTDSSSNHLFDDIIAAKRQQ